MVWRGTAVTPLLTHWSCCSLALGRRCVPVTFSIVFYAGCPYEHVPHYLNNSTPETFCLTIYAKPCDKLFFTMWYYGCLSSLKDPFTWTLSVMDNEIYIFTQLKHCPFLYRTGCLLSISIQCDNWDVVPPICINTLSPIKGCGYSHPRGNTFLSWGDHLEAERPNSDLKSL